MKLHWQARRCASATHAGPGQVPWQLDLRAVQLGFPAPHRTWSRPRERLGFAPRHWWRSRATSAMLVASMREQAKQTSVTPPTLPAGQWHGSTSIKRPQIEPSTRHRGSRATKTPEHCSTADTARLALVPSRTATALLPVTPIRSTTTTKQMPISTLRPTAIDGEWCTPQFATALWTWENQRPAACPRQQRKQLGTPAAGSAVMCMCGSAARL